MDGADPVASRYPSRLSRQGVVPPNTYSYVAQTVYKSRHGSGSPYFILRPLRH